MDKVLSSIIPEAYAYENKVFPLEVTDKNLIVQMENFDLSIINDLKIITGRNIKVKISKKDTILENIAQYYENESESGNRGELIFENIISDAFLQRASDIHIEPEKELMRIRFRIDGELENKGTYTIKEYTELSTIIKLKANCDITEKRLPQDGRFTVDSEKFSIDVRLSCIPVVNGEKLEMRILDRKNFLKNGTELGFSEEAVEAIKNIISKKRGLFIVTGTTGSGKSSTVYSIINELKYKNMNITTIEDPVEYSVDGINQIQINQKAGLKFNNGLRAILRQDPDCIVIGEIRDEETAQIAVSAAITGHIVITTLHTGSTEAAITRLKDIGIERYKITASLTGVLHQKLVKNTENIKGRRLVYEILIIDEEIKKSIKNGCDEKKIREIALKNEKIISNQNSYNQ